MALIGQGNAFEKCYLKISFCTQWHLGIKSRLEHSGSQFAEHFRVYFRVQRQKWCRFVISESNLLQNDFCMCA